MTTHSTTALLRRIVHDDDYLTIWLAAGYSKEYRHLIRHRLKQKMLGEALKEAILAKLGCQLQKPAREAAWSVPSNW